MRKEQAVRLPRLDNNVGLFERAVSAFAGTYMGYQALKDESILEAFVAGYLLFRGMTGSCPAYSAMGKHTIHGHSRNVNIQTYITVKRPRMEVYEFWRRLENLPLFMKHLESVTELDSQISEWKAVLPGGIGPISWKSEIMKDEPGKLLGWQSLPGSAIENAGKVEFSDAGGQATQLHVVITYRAPMGLVGEGVATLLNPLFENLVKEDVRHFKKFMEASEKIPSEEENLFLG